MMTLDNFIHTLKDKFKEQPFSIENICYAFIRKEKINVDVQLFNGEIEKISINSFNNQYVNIEDLEKIQKRISNSQYEKSINIFNWIGLYLQEQLQDNENLFFQNKLKEKFDVHSLRYKYLIQKVFEDYEDDLKTAIKLEIHDKQEFTFLLRYIFLEEEIDINKILKKFQNNNDLDFIDLLLLEDLRDIKLTSYNKEQKKLFDNILWIITEIQNNHKNFNNSEDQYNATIRSLLTAKYYQAHDQTQLGESSTKKSTGELDIAIFTKENLPLSIFEAFNLKSIDSSSITKHLLKLSKNYDPNGIKYNYAVIYGQNANFAELWERYKDFVPSIDFEHKIQDNIFEDITNNYPNYAGIRIGQTQHLNRNMITYIYHFFLDMNFED